MCVCVHVQQDGQANSGSPGGGVTAAWPCKYMIFITTLSLGACTSGAKLMWANKRLAVRFTPLLMRTIMSVPHTTTGSNGLS